MKVYGVFRRKENGEVVPHYTGRGYGTPAFYDNLGSARRERSRYGSSLFILEFDIADGKEVVE